MVVNSTYGFFRDPVKMYKLYLYERQVLVMMYQKFGERVKRQRMLAELTQDKLAQMAGISLSFLGHIERGTRKASLDTVVKLSNALKVSPNFLLQDSLDDGLLDYSVEITPNQRRLLREISNRIIEYGADMSNSQDSKNEGL